MFKSITKRKLIGKIKPISTVVREILQFSVKQLEHCVSVTGIILVCDIAMLAFIFPSELPILS